MTVGAASNWAGGFLAHRARLNLCSMSLIVSRSVTRAMTKRSVVINFKQLIERGYGGDCSQYLLQRVWVFVQCLHRKPAQAMLNCHAELPC